MPGGKVDYGENIEQAVEREVKEETGIDAKFKSINGIVNEVVFNKGNIVLHSVIFVCNVSTSNFNIKESEEGELRWIELKNLDEIRQEMIPSDYLMIRKFSEPFRSLPKEGERKKIKAYKVKMIENGEKYKIETTDL